ncbi:hypothetical protein [Streptomyces sedi]|uniref:Uncharacterized protein n=1 Tax=Streptomyces sedi TaxID=555059 RepID=A0A5C4VCG4_9ACTN|nr:hypothetical protein [Streptomyces sedi]TNM33561.1 hypothetical protein FH715_04195 [Streptomyces sedi]
MTHLSEEDLDGVLRSYYLLEFLYIPAPHSFDQGYLSTDPDELRRVLAERYSEGSPLTGIGELVCLWVVQRGTLTHGIDLGPHLHARCVDGETRTLADLCVGDGDGEPLPALHHGRSYTIDWATAVAHLPPLTEPLATPDEHEEPLLLVDPADPDPLPGMPIAVGDKEFLTYGWTDLN